MMSKLSTTTRPGGSGEDLDLIPPGEVLAEEFMLPLGLSQNRLARDIDVPVSRVAAIVHGERAISADTALRLGQYFGTTPELWLRLQQAYDLRVARRERWAEISDKVRPLSSASGS